jgi:AcrR family transcriptional regulator
MSVFRRGWPVTGPGVDPDSPAGRGVGAAPSTIAAADVRGPLDRRKVLLAAVALIDRSELRQLTMRRLGTELGVEAMSLYHYVHSREDLLDGVVELVIDDCTGTPTFT